MPEDNTMPKAKSIGGQSFSVLPKESLWPIVAFSLLLCLIWIGRYSLERSNQGAIVYKLDRWTGKVEMIQFDTSREVKKAPKEQ